MRIVDSARRMGSQVESSQAGPITCYVITPPEEMADAVPTGTMCSVTKPTKIAVIELSTKSPSAKVSLSKMQSIARKVLSRL